MIKIEDVDMTVRLYNSLKNAGINTVEDALFLSEGELLKFKGLGKKSLLELDSIIISHYPDRPLPHTDLYVSPIGDDGLVILQNPPSDEEMSFAPDELDALVLWWGKNRQIVKSLWDKASEKDDRQCEMEEVFSGHS